MKARAARSASWAVLAALAVACSGLTPSATPAQGTPAGPGASQPPPATAQGTPAGPGASQPPPATAGDGDLVGTITYEDSHSFTSEPGLPVESGDDHFTATVNVSLSRDPNGTGVEFIDDGSTYSFTWSTRRQREVGIPPCQVITESVAEVASADAAGFVDSDTASEGDSVISATIDQSLGIYILSIAINYPYTSTLNDCGRTQVIDTSGVFAGGPLACGFLGLTGKLVAGASGADQIDMACSQSAPTASVNVSGTLTLRE